MNRKVLASLLVGLVVLGFILGGIAFISRISSISRLKNAIPQNEKVEITNLVESFGKVLVKVDKTAPKEVVAQNIKQYYSPYLEDNLLLRWTFDPSLSLGRDVSSPWPDHIEILSMEKLDSNTVKVKGYVVWVTSGNGTLEVKEKVPIVLIVRKDTLTQKFLIERAWSNEYAFYDGKKLIKTLKEAFSDNITGTNYEPFVERVMYLTRGTSPEPVAVVDMGAGGAYTEYYTLCIPSNGNLIVANFKNKDGNISPLFFDEGASVKHEATFNFKEDGLGNLIVFQSVIDRNDSGKVIGITVEAYVWNKDTKLFEFSKDLSESIKRDLEEKISLKAVNISSLKFKEIESNSNAIGTFAIYNGKVAFSCGSEKNMINDPSGTIKNIVLYDVRQNKAVFLTSLDKPWVNIDKIEMDDNWILFRAVENAVGVPAECFAINRQTRKIQIVVPTEFEGKYVVINNIALVGDNAFVSMNVFEKKLIPEQAFSSGMSLGEELVEINLRTLKPTIIFDGTNDHKHIAVLQRVKDYIVYLVEPAPSDKKTEKTLFVYKDGVSSKISGIPVELIDSLRGAKDDSFIIFVINSKDAFAYISNLNTYNYIPFEGNIIGIALGSKNYFVSQETEADGKSSFLMPTEMYSKIYVFNRGTAKYSIIRLDCYPFNLSIYGNEIGFIKRKDGEKDSIIYINLEENGL